MDPSTCTGATNNNNNTTTANKNHRLINKP
jgi:hypothetical protein